MRKWKAKGSIHCCDVARLTSILLCISDLKQVWKKNWRSKVFGTGIRDFFWWSSSGIFFL